MDIDMDIDMDMDMDMVDIAIFTDWVMSVRRGWKPHFSPR